MDEGLLLGRGDQLVGFGMLKHIRHDRSGMTHRRLECSLQHESLNKIRGRVRKCTSHSSDTSMHAPRTEPGHDGISSACKRAGPKVPRPPEPEKEQKTAA